MQKRGQVTLFVVLGIILVIIISFGVYFRNEISSSLTKVELSEREKALTIEQGIETYAGDCLKKTTIDALQNVFANGGYWDSGKGVPYSGYTIPYYLNGNKENVPTLDDVKRSLEAYIAENVDSCLQTYPENLNLGQIGVKAVFNKKLLVNVDQDISLMNEGNMISINNYNAVVDVNLKKIYGSSITLFDKVKNISNIKLVDEVEYAEQNGFTLFTPSFPNETGYIFVLYYNHSIENEKSIAYNFAVKYPEVKVPLTQNEMLFFQETSVPIELDEGDSSNDEQIFSAIDNYFLNEEDVEEENEP